MAAEYYIRPPDSEEASGPYTPDELQSLAEAGKVEESTLFYDEQTEEWKALAQAPEELKSTVFPAKRTLTLRRQPGEEDETGEVEAEVIEEEEYEEEDERLTVEDMLAAAEGKTEETRHLVVTRESEAKAASLAVPALAVMLLLSAAGLIWPGVEIVRQAIDEESYGLILQRPLLILGAVDLFFAICLFLTVTEVFALVRLRAALGLGYFGFWYWAQWYNGDENSLIPMAAVLAAHVGLFACTVLNRYIPMAVAALLGVGGMAAFAYFIAFGGA